jgi:hypothetical protein
VVRGSTDVFRNTTHGHGPKISRDIQPRFQVAENAEDKLQISSE